MADKVAVPQGLDILGLLSGQKTTTSGGTTTSSETGTVSGTPADISGLQNVLGQLQSADYTKMLQSIFQQAGGQIPGLQAAYGNAIGARSRNNSAVQAALNNLLQQTSVAAQDQIAKQTLANQQQQVQAASNIAQATKDQTKTTTSTGTQSKAPAVQTQQADLGNLMKNLLIMQTMSKMGVFEKLGIQNPAQMMTQQAATNATTQGAAPAKTTSAQAPSYSGISAPSIEQAGQQILANSGLQLGVQSVLPTAPDQTILDLFNPQTDFFQQPVTLESSLQPGTLTMPNQVESNPFNQLDVFQQAPADNLQMPSFEDVQDYTLDLWPA